MAFAVDPDRPVDRSLARIGRALVASAQDSLSHLAEDPVLGVHDARRDIRISRAVVRLMRQVIGEEAYHEQNARLRRAAGMLSAHRDAQVLASAFDRLIEHAGDPAPEHSGALREAITPGTTPATEPITLAAASALLELAGHDAAVDAWPRAREDADTLVAEGFAHTLRCARKSVERAGDHPTIAELHDLRKRSKDIRDQLRVLMPLAPKAFDKLQGRFDKVTDLLGEGRDQLLLADSLELAAAAHPDLAGAASALREAAIARHDTLARRALAAAQAIDAPPGRTSRRLLRAR